MTSKNISIKDAINDKIKAAVIFYHKNLLKIYKPRWIEQCIQSIKHQTYTDFDIFELDYGNTNYKIPKLDSTYFYNESFENHIYAMNFILNRVFAAGYDVVFNTNLDDFYHPDRFKLQINKIAEGYDLVSSDFCYIEEINESQDIIFKIKHIYKYSDIMHNLKKGHNIIAHPAVAITKNFWKDYKYNPELIGWEDLELWQRAIDNKKFFIIDKVLLFYRTHKEQVTKTWDKGTNIRIPCPPCLINSSLHDENVSILLS